MLNPRLIAGLTAAVEANELALIDNTPPDEPRSALTLVRIHRKAAGGFRAVSLARSSPEGLVDALTSCPSLAMPSGDKAAKFWAKELVTLPGRYETLYAQAPEIITTALSFHPALYWHAQAGCGQGCYLSLRHGVNPHHAVHHLGPLLNAPRPDSGRFVEFCDLLGLDPRARARLAAFAVGTLLRLDISVMPLLAVVSPFKNVGKTTIARLLGGIYTGDPNTKPETWGGTDEFAKMLGRHIDAGAFIWVDNVDLAKGKPGHNALRSPHLATLLQHPSLVVRRLCQNTGILVQRPVFVFTINDAILANDLSDRCLCLDITTRPSPAARRVDARYWVDEHWADVRDDLLVHLLQSTPLPAADAARFGRFTEWYRRVAPVVQSLGLDPAHLSTSIDPVYIVHYAQLLNSVRGYLYSTGKDAFSVAQFTKALSYTGNNYHLCAHLGFNGNDRTLPDSEIERLVSEMLDTLATSRPHVSAHGTFRVVPRGPGEYSLLNTDAGP